MLLNNMQWLALWQIYIFQIYQIIFVVGPIASRRLFQTMPSEPGGASALYTWKSFLHPKVLYTPESALYTWNFQWKLFIHLKVSSEGLLVFLHTWLRQLSPPHRLGLASQSGRDLSGHTSRSQHRWTSQTSNFGLLKVLIEKINLLTMTYRSFLLDRGAESFW